MPQVLIEKALKFKVKGSDSDYNYEFIIECPEDGWTMEQATYTSYHIMKNIYAGSIAEVYIGDELMYTLEKNAYLRLSPITKC